MFSLPDIAATDLANITSRLTGTPYLTQEVIFGAGEPISPNEYIGIGKGDTFLAANNF